MIGQIIELFTIKQPMKYLIQNQFKASIPATIIIAVVSGDSSSITTAVIDGNRCIFNLNTNKIRRSLVKTDLSEIDLKIVELLEKDDVENIDQAIFVSYPNLQKMIKNGTIIDSFTLCAIQLALTHYPNLFLLS
jgi:hypothetical protein